MSSNTALVSQLLDQAAGKARTPTSTGRAAYLTSSATLLSLGAAAVWGVALGCTDPALALANAYKVPMVLALSLLGAVPPALLWLRLGGTSLSTHAVLASAAQGTFAGTMWLGVLSPLVGLYFYTSSWAGPYLAMAGCLVALAFGFRTTLSRLAQHADTPEELRLARQCGLTMFVLQLLVMWQLISLVSPLLPDASVFSGGVDGLRGLW